MKLEEKMLVSYRDIKGKIIFVCEQYATFNPMNSRALLLIYRNNWADVTLP